MKESLHHRFYLEYITFGIRNHYNFRRDMQIGANLLVRKIIQLHEWEMILHFDPFTSMKIFPRAQDNNHCIRNN